MSKASAVWRTLPRELAEPTCSCPNATTLLASRETGGWLRPRGGVTAELLHIGRARFAGLALKWAKDKLEKRKPGEAHGGQSGIASWCEERDGGRAMLRQRAPGGRQEGRFLLIQKWLPEPLESGQLPKSP